MTAPGGDSDENPRANADQAWADAGGPVPDQGGWAYPSGPSGFDPYAARGYGPPAGFPPPPPQPLPPLQQGGYPPPGGFPPPGYGPPADYPGYGPPQGPPPGYPTAGYGPPQGPPPGYPPAGYPPAGYGPPPGYPPAGPGAPYPGGYFTPAQAQRTNVLAISSLVVALLGLLFWPLALVGAVLGVIALSQIKRTGEAGHGLAVAGTAVGGAAVVLSFILAMAALH